MNSDKRYEIFSRLREHIKQPRSELEYRSNFELLISVLLSAQATDISVNKATAKLYPVANTPQKMLALGEAGVKQYIKTIGLFNSKAKNIIATCKILSCLSSMMALYPMTASPWKRYPAWGAKPRT
jgi:endonuclease-3